MRGHQVEKKDRSALSPNEGLAVEDSELGAGKTCFVVSPIGSALEPLGTEGRVSYERALEMWSKVFAPACAVFGLNVVRADKIADPGELPDQIFTYLRDSEVVIADLSGGNPNVMYELGLRHSKHALTVQIGEYNRLPFDLQSIRTIQFKRDEMGLIEARNALVEALRAGLANGPTPLRATEVFADNAEVSVDPEADSARSARPDPTDAVPEEPGLLEVMADGEAALTHLSTVLGDFSVGIQQVGSVTEAAGQQIQDPQVVAKGFAGRLLVAKDLAEKLEPLAQGMSDDADSFSSDVDLVDAMLKNILARADGEDPVEIEDFLDKVGQMLDAAEEGAGGIMKMKEGVKSIRALSRDLRPASDTLDRALSKVIAGVRVMLDWREPMAEVRAGLDTNPAN